VLPKQSAEQARNYRYSLAKVEQSCDDRLPLRRRRTRRGRDVNGAAAADSPVLSESTAPQESAQQAS